MKNKGRRHKAGNNSDMNGIGNCKGLGVILTRPITSMATYSDKWFRGKNKKYIKKGWSKRVRGYFKSQTKDILGFYEL